MVLSREEGADAHPYWYARIIKIFEVTIRHVPAGTEGWAAERRHMDVLWCVGSDGIQDPSLGGKSDDFTP